MPSPLLDDDPAQVGPYRLSARLGGGGMGQVFLGHSPGGHTVAVKVVRPELAQDVDFRRRFATEVTAARKVGGFYTAQVVDADTDSTPPWLATAYIPGPTLHRAVTDHGPLPTGSVAVLGAGLAEGLTAVHAHGLVHRDLKPANVLLTQDGPRLIDFGIARALDSTSHTHSSTVLGTAAFMSPEQARAQQVGPASDVFSLGCVLAFAATGRSPFGQGPIHAVIFRVVHEEPDLDGISTPLRDLIGACLAKDPGARPGLDEILTALVTTTPSDRTRDRRHWLPDDLTEVIGRHRTLPLTTVTPTARVKPSDRPRVPSQPQPVPAEWPRFSLADERALTLGRGHPHPANLYQYAVYVLLALFTLLSVITVIQQIVGAASLNEWHSQQAGWYHHEALWTIYCIQIASGVGLVVAWLLWFRQLRTIAEELEPGRLRFPPSMAVLGWLIPLANLFLPKMIANDIWHASSPPDKDGRMAPAALLHTWWILWLATFLTWPVFWLRWSEFVIREWDDLGDDDTATDLYFYDYEPVIWLNLAVRVVAIPAAIAAALFVQRLTAMQAARLNA
ncbi:serine/threonine protein kinase [Nocardiopsis sp. Huas11]|uniref:protein kinase domain-containing protein n=1 Tax=Nocardiopsis sp. Huas11 TaxID=2183912 RepID=UPI000F1097FA|nr:protein kinase [Nocardiopsis sp. Huas11]RKS09312.1 serine/threonine protein kinase [Nocardiopsis sp. Huas11]